MLERRRRLQAALGLAGFIVAISLWMDFSAFHNHQHSDALIPILVSLQHWTPFFWAQDRFGMFVPWLARGLRSPFANLVFQDGVNIALGIASFALLADYLLPKRKDWIPPAAIAISLFIAFAAENERFDVFSGCQPYASSIAIGLCGLELLREDRALAFGWRMLLSIPCFMIAEWINVGAILPLAPLACARTAIDLWETRDWKRGRGPAIGILLLYLATRLSLHWSSAIDHAGIQVTVQTWAPRGEWFARAQEWGRAAWQKMGDHLWETWLGVTAVIGTLSLASSRVRAQGVDRVLAAAGVIIAALFSFYVIGLTDWVRGNGYALRYALPPILLTAVAAGQLAAIPLDLIPMDVRWRRSAFAIPIVVAIGASYGAPAPSKIETAFDEHWGQAAREVVEANATHVAGDYWRIWPVVFRANWLHWERADGKQVFGLAHRAEGTFAESRAIPADQLRVAILRGDGSLGYLGALQQPGWALVARSSIVDIIVPRR